MKVFNINDSYFKYKKCLSGITYQFVNQLDNIYDKNLMVGTNYCIYCMYNEFDIINNFMINLNQIDICSTSNLDLSMRYYDIDGAYLRTGHKVLLVNQNNPVENDIYIVDTRGYLNLSNELSDTGKTWRYKAYIKLGNNKGKQFHLINTGNRFPLKGERKYFLDGHGYIIKNFFNYDLFDTSSIMPKIIFTDYELARISVNENYSLYNGFALPTSFNEGDTINIQYHLNDYLIKVDDNLTKYTYTGVTSSNSIYNSSGATFKNGYETYIKTDSTFCSNAMINDYIKLELSGTTELYLKTFIKETGTTYIIISDYIPDNILKDYYFNTGMTTYTITNLMYSPQFSIEETMLESYYSNYFDITSSRSVITKENINNKYFDYDGFNFIFSGTSVITKNFTTGNHYIKFQLYEHLNEINPFIFNSTFSFLIDFTLYNNEFHIERYDNYPNIYSTTNGDIKGTYIKIVPYVHSSVNYFKKYTYINILDESGSKYKSLIVDLVPNEYFIIESYKSNTGLTSNIDIETIYNLQEISDILYDVYINETNPNNIDYYRISDDNKRRNICNGYAEFISQDIEIINNVTAFLMLDPKNKFILKVYDPENLNNGGLIRTPYVVTKLITTIGSTWGQLMGQIINDGGSNITSYGFYYSTNPLIQDMCISASTSSNYFGDFLLNSVNLHPSTRYYYKAFAQNNQGKGYGEILYFTTDSPFLSPPTVVTIGSIPSSNSITFNAEVVNNGYSEILLRGVMYQTGITTPTTGDTTIYWEEENGLIGNYSIIITGLSYDTTYSYNSIATNDCGTTYGDSGYTNTLYPSPPTVKTNGNLNIMFDSFDALCSLIVNDVPGVTDVGVVWASGYTIDPTIYDNIAPYSGTLPSPFNLIDYIVSITGLSYSTNYNFRSYAINNLYSGSTTSYGITKNIVTSPIPIPVVNISNISSTISSSNINIVVNDNGEDLTSLSLYYTTGTTVTTGNTHLSTTGSTNWTCSLTGLTELTYYSILVEAINAYGTGTTLSGFTTLSGPPIVDLTHISSNSYESTLNGNVSSSIPLLSKGIQYSGGTFTNWTTKTENTEIGSWISIINNLSGNTTYWARSYASNLNGNAYSNIISWITPTGNTTPSFSLESPIVDLISLNSSIIRNNIVNDGGSSVISSGIIYSGITTSGWTNLYSGVTIGEWSNEITGLTSGSTYYVYAYATNLIGTTNTPTTGFTTLSVTLPYVIINSVNNITTNEATINSEIVSNGNSPIISMGVSITGDTSSYWTYNDFNDTLFSINLTGLTENTSYTGSSYATNSSGTTWSDLEYFVTLPTNNLEINLNISSATSLNPYVYQVGDLIEDIITTVNITRNSVPLYELWSGNTVFTSPYGIPTTGLTWGAGIETANNSNYPYIYEPLGEETQYFIASESCGNPSTIKTSIKTINSIYPFLTGNGLPFNKSIPDPLTVSKWCENGGFYTDMDKKIEVFSSKNYNYNIAGDNLIYFAYPSSYGFLKSINIFMPLETTSTTIINPTIYPDIRLYSHGLSTDWNNLYHVYLFMVAQNKGLINVKYNF